MPVAGQATAERVPDAVTVSGVVFQDDNRNGVRDPGESGVPGVAVSDQVQVVNTDASGRFTIAARGYGVVFVSQPEGYVDARCAGDRDGAAAARDEPALARRVSEARLVKFPNVLTAAQIAVLDELHERDRKERQAGKRDALSPKALAPSVAQLLYLLIVQKGATSIVEFGTSHGYCTIHLAAAAEETGGRVHTVDAIPAKTASAAGNLEAAGVLHRVMLATCDGTDFVATLADGIDFKALLEEDPCFVVTVVPMHKEQLIAVRVAA
jgi:hypothetical protein